MRRHAAMNLLPLLPLLALGACTTTPLQPLEGSRFRVEASVDPASAALTNAGATSPGGPPGQRAPEPLMQDPEPPSPGPPSQATQNAEFRARFGSHILIKPDGRITKEYFLSGASGNVRAQPAHRAGIEEPANQAIVPARRRNTQPECPGAHARFARRRVPVPRWL